MKTPDPLHGVTLETVLNRLVEHYGWEELGRAIEIRCFNFDPSVKSSLAFLRKTPWARKKVEDLYVGIARKWDDGAAPGTGPAPDGTGQPHQPPQTPRLP
ncbi:MAG: DUF2132 domain-containing protein [Opitutae bacterium]|nr:DUF2132 domain-containing protein [Opitutae bacterium]